MTRRILTLARAMGAQAEEEVLTCFCAAAREQLQRRLRQGVRAEQCGDAFPLAGACLVLAELECSRCYGAAESFTAGDVSVRTGRAEDRAGQLRRQAERLMAPWLEDSKFVFYGVRGG